MATTEIGSFNRGIAVLKLSSEMLLHKNEEGVEVGIDDQAVEDVADHVAEVNEELHPLIVVGSAVGAGRGFLKSVGKEYKGVDLQVLASYGTPDVSVALRNALAKRDIHSGQVLADHTKMVAGSTLMEGIVYGIIKFQNAYHINENDQQNKYELKLLEEEEAAEKKQVREKLLGLDNDPLASQLTIALIEELVALGLDQELAVHLVMFTRIGGFAVKGVVQSEILGSKKEKVYAMCNGARKGGSGGMKIKVEKCFDALEAGAKTVHIASPEQNWLNVIRDKGETGKVTRVVQ
jgi:glutamate 5-kinase